MPTGGKKKIQTILSLLTVLTISGCLESASQDDTAATATAKTGNTNNAPTISGSPDPAILAGDVYSFAPSASDADNDTLTFSIANLPRWATFDSATGRLSGQALLGDIGVYDNIRISVSDSDSTASLPEFSITVTQSALGTMTLSWTPPTENTDGTALRDLAGYKLYFGVSQNSYTNQVRIDNPSISTYVVENLLPDTYYIVATSFNTAGDESAYSNVAVKTVTAN